MVAPRRPAAVVVNCWRRLAQPTGRAGVQTPAAPAGRADESAQPAGRACCEGSLCFVIDSSPKKALFVIAQRVAQLEGLQQGAASHRAAHDRAVGGELVVPRWFSRAPGARVPAVLSGVKRRVLAAVSPGSVVLPSGRATVVS